MSIPSRSIYCSKCNYEYPIPFSYYVYKLRDGSSISIPSGLGWCSECQGISEIQFGMSVYYLTRVIDDLNRKVEKHKRNAFQFLNSSIGEKEEVKHLEDEIQNANKYLTVLKGKDSLHSCLKCGSKEVFPFNGYPKLFTYADTGLPYTHVNCGGQFKVKDTGYRFSFVSQEIVVEPKFVNP
jgi:hypothetical protein